LLLTITGTYARSEVPPLPAISIIIDDMGKRLQTGQRVIDLPGPVACAFLPQAKHTSALADLAWLSDKEVMLHLPMESVHRRSLDAGALKLDMTEGQFRKTVQQNLAAVPHVTGVNNHMGSLLTRHPGHMLWLMRVLQGYGGGRLFFVDSRTTTATVARRAALESGVPSIDRKVFLDNELQSGAIAFQFQRLLKLARQEGVAVAIGHPYPQTLSLLERSIPQLQDYGIRLVPVSKLIQMQQHKGESTWQASWSPSHRAAKNSKPSL
jgi:polysaccharide deacetylase 2 family uncharacterized protein YibQ